MTKYKHTIISFSLISWNNPSPQKIRKTKDNRIRTYTEPAILIDETFQFSHAVSIKIIINWLAACKDVSFGYCSGTGESVTKQKTARGDGKRERERERERERGGGLDPEVERRTKHEGRSERRSGEKERDRAFHKAILRTLFSHAHVESKAHVRYLTETRWRRAYIIGSAYTNDDIDSLRSMKLARGGWLGSSMTGLRTPVYATNVYRVRSLSLSLSLSLYLAASLPPFLSVFVCLRAK